MYIIKTIWTLHSHNSHWKKYSIAMEVYKLKLFSYTIRSKLLHCYLKITISGSLIT
jgi:hypothetical protein